MPTEPRAIRDQRFDAGSALDNATPGSRHMMVALLAMSVIVLDGFDLQVLGFEIGRAHV